MNELKIVSDSLLSLIFPKSSKIAVVKLLLKKGKKEIIEKALLNQLQNSLNVNGFLDRFHSGFRQHEPAHIKTMSEQIHLNTGSSKSKISVKNLVQHFIFINYFNYYFIIIYYFILCLDKL